MELDAMEATVPSLFFDIVAYQSRWRDTISECQTPASSTNNRKQLPLNAGSGCWMYHALNMTSFDLKYTSPLIASASLTWAFNQTL